MKTACYSHTEAFAIMDAAFRNPSNDFVVLGSRKSKKILARAHTEDGAEQKAKLLKLEMPFITRQRYLK